MAEVLYTRGVAGAPDNRGDALVMFVTNMHCIHYRVQGSTKMLTCLNCNHCQTCLLCVVQYTDSYNFLPTKEHLGDLFFTCKGTHSRRKELMATELNPPRNLDTPYENHHTTPFPSSYCSLRRWQMGILHDTAVSMTPALLCRCKGMQTSCRGPRRRRPSKP